MLRPSWNTIRAIVMLSLMVTGMGLIVLVFSIGFIGKGTDYLRLRYVLLLVFASGMFLLGIALYFFRNYLTEEFFTEKVQNFRQFLRTSLPDIGWAFCIYVLGIVVGTLYVSTVHSSGKGLIYFYKETMTIEQSKLLGGVWPNGILLGTVLALFYGICRLGMGRLLAAACTLGFMVSPNHLHNLVPSIMRDYAKVPFILASILIIGLLGNFPLKWGRLFCLSILGGIILSLGLCIRQDMLVFIVPFIMVILFFLPGSMLANFKIKMIALVLFAASFLMIAFPNIQQSQSSGPHRVIAGFMLPFNDRLAVSSPAYDWGHLYLDEFVWAITYGQAKASDPSYAYSYSRTEYDHLGFNYLKKIVTNFPGDILTRAYAAILNILELPFNYLEPAIGIKNKYILTFYSWRATILGFFAGTGIFLCVLALLLISAENLRKAIFFLFFLVYFAGYPFLQFQGRHYFYLEFITWWILGFIIQQCSKFGRLLLVRDGRRDFVALFITPSAGHWLSTPIKRMLVFTVVCLIILLVPLLVSRQYQSWQVENILGQYSNAAMERLPLIHLIRGNNLVLMTSPGQFTPVPENSSAVDYLMAEFETSADHCSTVWPVFNYETITNAGRSGFSRSMRIDLVNSKKGSTKVFFPALSCNIGSLSTYFNGIELPQEQASCLRGLYRVKDANLLPILLTVVLYPGLDQSSLYQTLTCKKGHIYSVPMNLHDRLVKRLLKSQLTPLTSADLAFQADILHFEADKLVINGYARPFNDPFNHPALSRSHSILTGASFADVSVGIVDTDLLRTRGILLKRGSFFIAQGVMYSGGAIFGLIKHGGHTAGSVSVTSRGPFTVIIEVPEDNLYSIGLANNLDGYTSLENRFVVNRAGWLKEP